MAEAFRSLVRQAIDQIDVDAVKSQRPRRANQIAGHLERLNAVNRLLDVGMEILNPHAQAVKPEPPQRFEVFARCDPRVDFDSDLRVGGEAKAFSSSPEQIFNL